MRTRLQRLKRRRRQRSQRRNRPKRQKKLRKRLRRQRINLSPRKQSLKKRNLPESKETESEETKPSETVKETDPTESEDKKPAETEETESSKPEEAKPSEAQNEEPGEPSETDPSQTTKPDEDVHETTVTPETGGKDDTHSVAPKNALSGNGTASSPYVVDNFADLKANLQSSENCYIVVNSFQDSTVFKNCYHLTSEVDFNPQDVAISIPAGTTKHLTINTKMEFHTSADGALYSFIGVDGGTLYVDGTGSLNVPFNATYARNGVFLIQGYSGNLILGGSITVRGDSDAADYYGAGNCSGHAVVNESGTVTINSGTYIGRLSTAVLTRGSGKTTINGGVFKLEEPSYSSYTLHKEGSDSKLIIKGGRFDYAKGEYYDYLASGFVLVDDSTDDKVAKEDIDRLKTYYVSNRNITSVSVTIDAPTIGAKPDYTAVFPSGVKYYSDVYNGGNYRNDICWKDNTTNSYMVPENDAFKAGHQYFVAVYLTAKDGYEFSYDTTATVNGQNADIEMDGDQLIVKYTFETITSANTLSVKPKTAKVKYKKLRKKKQTVARSKVMTVSNPQGNVKYSLVTVKRGKSKKYKKYFKINATTGTVTVKKKLRKGTYKITCKVTAGGNEAYKSATKTVTFKIKVK